MDDNAQHTITAALPEEVRSLIRKGMKIEAIGLARKMLALDLKHAKQLVDAAEAELREHMPGSTQEGKRPGCAASMLLVALLIVAAIAGWI